MKEEKKQMTELKEWWAKCPAKSVMCGLSLILSLVAINCVYELGVAFGKFLYYIGV